MWRTGGKGSGPRGQQAQRPVVAVTCLRTTRNPCGRRQGAEARSRGAFRPSEETGVYEAQWKARSAPWRGVTERRLGSAQPCGQGHALPSLPPGCVPASTLA